VNPSLRHVFVARKHIATVLRAKNFGSCATERCEPGQAVTGAALSIHFGVPQGNLEFLRPKNGRKEKDKPKDVIPGIGKKIPSPDL